MVVVGYYHLFTRRQASNKAEESVNFTNLYIRRFFAIALNDKVDMDKNICHSE